MFCMGTIDVLVFFRLIRNIAHFSGGGTFIWRRASSTKRAGFHLAFLTDGKS